MSCNCPTRKDFSNRSPLPSYSKNTSAAHVRSWKNTSKKTSKRKKKNLKKRAPSEPWEASYAEFCSYWPGLGGRSYWNYYFTSRDFHSIQTSCLADFTLRGTRHVFLVFFFFFKSELLYPVNMVQWHASYYVHSIHCIFSSFILYGRGCVQGMIFITDVRFQIQPSCMEIS